MKHIRQHALFLITLAILLTLLGFVLAADAELPFVVRVIYFQPTDADPAPDNLGQVMKDVQQLYENEMVRNGYAPKTFRLETDNAGKVVVHTVKSRHKAVHFANVPSISDALHKETPQKFKNPNNVHLFIVGNARTVKGAWGLAFPYTGKVCGGFAVVAQKANTANFLSLVAHELGHTFGLYHNIGCGTCLMGVGQKELTNYDARWLDKHHYFNDSHKITDVPKIVDLQELRVPGRLTDFVELAVTATSNNGLYQVQLLRHSDTAIIGWKALEGNRDTAEIKIKRSLLLNDTTLTLQIMGVQGNQLMRTFDFTLPPIPREKNPTLVKTEPEKEPVVETETPDRKPTTIDKNLAIYPQNKKIFIWARLKHR